MKFPGALSAGGFSPAVLLYFNRFDVDPAPDVKIKLAAFIDSLVLSGVYTLLDEFWIYANNTSHNALLGVKNYKDCTTFGNMTFTADRGFKKGIGSACLYTNYIPDTDKVNLGLNSASIGVYSRNSQNNVVDIGVSVPAGSLFFQSSSYDATHYVSAVNNNAWANGNVAGSTSIGLLVAMRNDAANIRTYKFGSFEDKVGVSTVIPTKMLYVCGNNNNGVLANDSSKEYCFAFVGAGLSNSQIVDMASQIEIYLDYIGAGVMP